ESTWRNPTRVALRSGDRSYEVETFSETAQKTGNLLRHLGVGEGSTVRITEDRTPESLFGFLGSALHGATTVFGDEGERKEDIVVGPTEKVDGKDTERKTLAYGDEPDDTSVVHFEREIWGENPVFPHDEVAGAEQVVLKSDS
ncbi:MAG: hypothetical protein SV760_01535, partial [Halobacteria archaeon]|nr:hypothetical protein [Halobacteria archaeon]